MGGVAMMQWLVIGVQSLILLAGFVWSFCNLSGCMKSKTSWQTQMHILLLIMYLYQSETRRNSLYVGLSWLRNVNEAITRQVVLGMDSSLSVPVLCMVWSTVSMYKVTQCQVFIPQLIHESCASVGFLYMYKPDQFFGCMACCGSRKKEYENIIKILTTYLRDCFQ